MLAVVDYGAGNLGSVLHALRHVGAQDMHVVQHPEQLAGAHKIILPGVGAFGAGMQVLRERHLVEPIVAIARSGVPFLGICVGMQLMFEVGEEMGIYEGLGLIQGRCVRFPHFADLKVPHMGWNTLRPTRKSPLLAGLPEENYAYFVHSYHCIPVNPGDTLLETVYGIPFCAAVQRDNLYGVQFHPEKSQRTGLQILKNFLAL
jgi:glutamine amidotransferase